MALGLWPTKTVLVQFGEVALFSDIDGRHKIHFVDDKQFRNELLGRLETVGCKVDRHGNDWLTAGNFKSIY